MNSNLDISGFTSVVYVVCFESSNYSKENNVIALN